MEVSRINSPLNKLTLLWLVIILPLVAAFLFRKSFGLGLYGDDWQHLYILWREFFVFHHKSFYDIHSYLNPYWPEYFYLGIIQHFWGYYPPAYFIASFLMRLFANIALYFFAYELTKSKLAAFLTSLIFLVSAAGLQTTDWVFNMNTYAGVGLLAVASVFYLKLRKLQTFKSWLYFWFTFTFTLGLAIVPTRMHGATPFIILTDLFLTFVVERQKIKFNKYLIGRIILAAIIFLTLIHFKSFGEQSYANGRFNDSYKLIQTLNENGYTSWWLYFIGIIGHLVLPDNINLSTFTIPLQAVLPIKNPFYAQLMVEFLISTTFLLIGSFAILKSKNKLYYLPPIVFNFLWLFFLIALTKIDSRTGSDIYFSISLGGQYLFWAIWIFLISRKKYPEISSALVLSVFWVFALTMLYWFFTPYYVIETTGRYMTVGAAGIALFLGALSTILLKSSMEDKPSNGSLFKSFYLIVPMFFLFGFILTNVQTSQNYFNILYQTRNQQLTQKTWDTLLQQVPKLDPTAPSVFFFTTDNPQSLEGVLVFGFFMRSGLEWRITDEALTPLPVTDYQQLLDMVKTGEPLQKVHGRKKAPVPLSRVFGFDFSNGTLTNITPQVRQKIASDLNLTR